ncbi:two pore potassium channel c-like [Ananas comosus]|uniref:Two pore potassium channel c-like n=1 Tax=Ananas comosus TaxID=4615 RepID=A0A6P5EIB6_ANACO|nr:two pore potassium channel c-like [Ananas comosus]
MGDNKKPLLSSLLLAPHPPLPPPLLLPPTPLLPAEPPAARRPRRHDRRTTTSSRPAVPNRQRCHASRVLIGAQLSPSAVIIYRRHRVIGFSRPSALSQKPPTTPRSTPSTSHSPPRTVGYGDAHPTGGRHSSSRSLSVRLHASSYPPQPHLVAVTVPRPPRRSRTVAPPPLTRGPDRRAAILLPVAAGALVFHLVETQGWVDSVYMSVISVTTVGYGDEVFKTRPGRAFASVWLLIGTLSVTHSFNFLVDKLLDWWTPRTNFVTSLHRLRQTIGKKRNRRKNYNVLVEIRLAAFGQMKNLGDE